MTPLVEENKRQLRKMMIVRILRERSNIGLETKYLLCRDIGGDGMKAEDGMNRSANAFKELLKNIEPN